MKSNVNSINLKSKNLNVWSLCLEHPSVTGEIVKCRFWCKLPLFDHFCGAPMQMMKIRDFPIYSFTNDLLPFSLYNLVFMKGPNCMP